MKKTILLLLIIFIGLTSCDNGQIVQDNTEQANAYDGTWRLDWEKDLPLSASLYIEGGGIVGTKTRRTKFIFDNGTFQYKHFTIEVIDDTTEGREYIEAANAVSDPHVYYTERKTGYNYILTEHIKGSVTETSSNSKQLTPAQGLDLSTGNLKDLTVDEIKNSNMNMEISWELQGTDLLIISPVEAPENKLPYLKQN